MEENELSAVQSDAVVQIAYNLTIDGEELESDVLEYLHGFGNIIPGLEEALTGMKIGESKDIHIEAAKAYGDYDNEMVLGVSRESFPPDFEIRLGEPMRLRDAEGHVFQGVATALSEDTVELDLNHPLAGKDLDFSVTVLALRPASDEELEHGHIHSGCESCSGGEDCAGGECSDGCCQ